MALADKRSPTRLSAVYSRLAHAATRFASFSTAYAIQELMNREAVTCTTCFAL
jgi:hypothetical protein